MLGVFVDPDQPGETMMQSIPRGAVAFQVLLGTQKRLYANFVDPSNHPRYLYKGQQTAGWQFYGYELSEIGATYPIPRGAQEMWITWPAPLDGSVPLRLMFFSQWMMDVHAALPERPHYPRTDMELMSGGVKDHLLVAPNTLQKLGGSLKEHRGPREHHAWQLRCAITEPTGIAAPFPGRVFMYLQQGSASSSPPPGFTYMDMSPEFRQVPAALATTVGTEWVMEWSGITPHYETSFYFLHSHTEDVRLTSENNRLNTL